MDAGGASGAADPRRRLVHELPFPGFVNTTNVANILLLAIPLAVAAMAQTHALLVGYLDLSVGSMISLGSGDRLFPHPTGASGTQILIGSAAVLLAGILVGLVNAGLVRGVKIPSIIATLATLSILDGISLTLRPAPGRRHRPRVPIACSAAASVRCP